jgi:glucuronoarabinoxylan endo-1,4-beta-xylanase
MKIFTKLRLWAAVLALSCAVGSGVAVAADATINMSAEKQTIRGFGGMNHPAWAGDLTAAQRETVFGNGDKQLGFTVLRIHVDENRNAWTNEITTAKYAFERGFIVFASPWNPPSSMTETFTHSSDKTSPKRLKKSSYGEYAAHLNDFVTYMKNNGVTLSAISIQNEPDYADEWTWWTGAEMVDFLKNNAGVINCNIIAPESFQYTKSTSDPILNDAQALANVDIIGAHLYGTQVSQFPYPLFKSKGAEKELWMTEVYHPNSSSPADTWPEALDVAQHVHNAMVEAEFQMYVWWYIRRSYSPLLENGTISKRGWMMAHFSKFVRPEYVRVDATKTPETNVFVSAYKSGNKVVVVAVNKKTAASSMNFTVNGGGTTGSVESWRTSGTENMVKAAGTIAVSGGKFSATLPAQSVTTFVGTLDGGGNTAVNVTCNVENLAASYAAGSGVPRPNVSCGGVIAVGAASFGISGSDSALTGWNSPGGAHIFYNTGTRTVTLGKIECGGAEVTVNPAISCGSFEIVPAPTTSAVNGGGVHIRPPLSVSVRGKSLFISASSPAVVEIYSVKGVRKASVNISCATQTVKLSLPDGVYFAKAQGTRNVKFTVR